MAWGSATVASHPRGPDAGDTVRSYDRASTEVHVEKLGLGLWVTFIPSDDSPGIKLTGTVSRGFTQAGPDRVVVHLLTDED